MAISLNNRKLFFFWALLSGIFFYAPHVQAAIIKPANSLGLVGYWNLDEGRGSAVYSHGSATSSGTATLFSSPSWTTGKLGQALTFGATNNYASTSVIWPSSDGSMALWVYPTLYSDWISPAGWKLLGTNNGFILLDEGGSGTPGRWRAVFNPNTTTGPGEVDAIALQNITQNVWQHLVMTWSLSGSTYTVHLYINGVDQGSTSWTGTPGTAGVGSFHFGNSGDYPDNYFKGKVDDVRVYNRALTLAETKALYYQTAGTRFNSSAQSAGNGSTLTQGLVARYTFDGADVTDKVYDRVGGNNGYTDGSVPTSTMKTAGKLGQAMSFNGSSSYINVPDASSLDSNVGSVSFWAKIPTASVGNGYFLVGKADGSSSLNGYSIFSYNGNFSVQIKNNSTSANLTDPSVRVGNVWHHVVLTYNSGNTSRLYVDGVQVDSQTAPSGISVTSQPLRIGKSNDSYWQVLNGSIDDVRIYNRVLTVSEITQLYGQGGGKINASGATLQNGSTVGAANGLIGYWSLNGADVTDKVYDRVGGNNGYYIGSATTTAKVQGKLGQALSFNGSTAYIRVPDASALDTNAFTLSVWVKYTASQLGGLISKGAGGTEMLLMVGGGVCGNASANGKIRFDVGVSSSLSCADSPSSYNDGKWHLITATRDGQASGNMTLYVDGVSVATATRTGDMTTSQPLAIGQHIPGVTWFFNGSMDEVRIYNRALSASEVKTLYNVGR